MSAEKVTHGLKVAGSVIGCASMMGGIAAVLLVGTSIGLGIAFLIRSKRPNSSNV